MQPLYVGWLSFLAPAWAQEGVGGVGLTATEVDCAAVQVDVEVEIRDFRFGPEELSLPAGGVARWTNRDRAPHTVTSGDPRDEEDEGELFDSGKLDQGEAFCLELSGGGSVDYFCEIHPEMRGRIRLE
jgi:plastocyanin